MAAQSVAAVAFSSRIWTASPSEAPCSVTTYRYSSSGRRPRRTVTCSAERPLCSRSTFCTWGSSAKAAATSSAVETAAGTVSSTVSLSTRASPRATDQRTG